MTTKFFSTLCAALTLVSSSMAQPKWVDAIKSESSMTYRLVHPLHKIEATSKDVFYRLQVDPVRKEIASVSGRVDVTTYDSGNSSRDSHAMEVIDAISYPEATFTSTAITQSGDSLKVAGKLTFHGVTKDIVIAAASQWSKNKLQVGGAFDVSLTAFNIERPSLLLIPVQDILSFSFTASFGLD